MSLIPELSPQEAREWARRRVAQRLAEDRRRAALRSVKALRREAPEPAPVAVAPVKPAPAPPPAPVWPPIKHPVGGMRDWLFVSVPGSERITMKAIMECVAARHELHVDALVSQRRDRGVTIPRREVSYVAAALTPLSLPQIGRRMNRDHTTVLHHIQVAQRDYGLPEPAKISRTHALEILHYGFDGFLTANGRTHE